MIAHALLATAVRLRFGVRFLLLRGGRRMTVGLALALMLMLGMFVAALVAVLVVMDMLALMSVLAVVSVLAVMGVLGGGMFLALARLPTMGMSAPS